MGLVIQQESGAPRPRPIDLVNVVLPAPKAPPRVITSPGVEILPRRLPRVSVISRDDNVIFFE